MRMTASDAILMRLVVTEPGDEPPACPWGLAINANGDPCDGKRCPLCSAAKQRNGGRGR